MNATTTTIPTTLDDSATCFSVGGVAPLQNEWDKTVCQVWRDLKNNKETVEYDAVEKIIGTYYDLQIQDNELPELNFEPSSTQAVNTNIRLINIVARYSGIDATATKATLMALFYAVRRGVASVRVLYPRRYVARYGDMREESSPITKYLKNGALVLGGVAALAAIYYLSNIANIVQQSSQHKS